VVTSTGAFVCSLSFLVRSWAKFKTTLFMALLCWHSPWTCSVVQNHYRSDLYRQSTCRVGFCFQRLDQKSRNKKFEVNVIYYKNCVKFCFLMAEYCHFITLIGFVGYYIQNTTCALSVLLLLGTKEDTKDVYSNDCCC
jgi:hypothetical protein